MLRVFVYFRTGRWISLEEELQNSKSCIFVQNNQIGLGREVLFFIEYSSVKLTV